MTPLSGWSGTDELPRLESGEAHVWRLPLDLSADKLPDLCTLLSSDERERAQRFVFDEHRARFVACRGQARRLLAAYLGAAPGELRFQYGSRGKPSLEFPWGERLAFNISHSHELALCALGRGCELGVDIEHIRPPSDFEGLAERFFAPQEVAAIKSLPQEARLASFFRCWTRKEAVLKACGSGLTLPLDRIVVTLGPDEPARVVAGGEETGSAAEWSLYHLEPAAGYVGALAWLGEPLKVSCFAGGWSRP